MNKKYFDIYTLIAKELTGSILFNEKKIIDEWCNEDIRNRNEYREIKQIWQKTEKFKLPNDINANKVKDEISRRIFEKMKYRKLKTTLMQMAAVFLLGIFITYFSVDYLFKKNYGVKNGALQEVKAAYGTQTKLELDDGSIVFLNSGSKLKLPNTFKNRDSRDVWLEGEAYFKVANNQNSPFVVRTSKLDIKVLGTTFNVDAYSTNQTMEVSLIEGSVLLQKREGENVSDIMELKPNQIASLNYNENVIRRSSIENLNRHVAWIDGVIVFYGDPIHKVVEKLSRWYNVEFEIEDKGLTDYVFTATFINESLEQVMDVLCLTSPMKYKIQTINGDKDIYGKRKVILKAK